MSFEFKLEISISSDGLGVSHMSEKAKQLAERINQHEDDRRRKEALQLHKAKIFEAKAGDFWRKFINTLKEEYTDFSDTLRQDSDYRIEHFNEPRGQNSVKLDRGFGFASAKVSLDIDARKITTGEWKPREVGERSSTKPCS